MGQVLITDNRFFMTLPTERKTRQFLEENIFATRIQLTEKRSSETAYDV